MSFYEKIIFPMKKKNNFPIGCWEFHNKIKKPNRNLNSNRIWKKSKHGKLKSDKKSSFPIGNPLFEINSCMKYLYHTGNINPLGFFLKIPFLQGFKISCKQIFFNKNYFSSMVYYYFEGKYLPCQLRHTKN